MLIQLYKCLLAFLLIFVITISFAQSHFDVVIVGGGASGTTAGIQASRMGVRTLIIEKTPWLGGMLTSAGVSAIDGNHQIPSGLWAEFRNELYKYYGGPKAVSTGWVSNTLFEPSVGNKILHAMASNSNLTIWHNAVLENILKDQNNLWTLSVSLNNKKKHTITATIIIDATELGDVAARLGVPYTIGMDSKYDTGESIAPEKANSFIQDITYVATLKDFGTKADKTIPKPIGYNEENYKNCCDIADVTITNKANNNCAQMLQYGRLPNNKYMINWPRDGNDFYTNIIDSSETVRQREFEKAKQCTLGFIYYIQTKLGYKNLGLADDEFPTNDKLPFFPYFRESRRIKGLVQLTLTDVKKPFDQKNALYRTGIAVGDYPLDHHSGKNKDAPKLDFFSNQIPSYNVPLGCLIPKNTGGLIVAEKSISVTNIVNGATRLQPVVLLIGQAAGSLAAISVKKNMEPKQISVREVQSALLDANAYIMPYIDVTLQHPYFKSIQKIGATGILRGSGVPYHWANQTWFYPEREISEYEFLQGLRSYYNIPAATMGTGAPLTNAFALKILYQIDSTITDKIFEEKIKNIFPEKQYSQEQKLNRALAAVLIDHFLNPFDIPVDIKGHLLK